MHRPQPRLPRTDTLFPDPVLFRSPEIVGSMSRDAVAGFHRHHYNAGAMVVAAAGNVEHEVLVDLAAERFGAIAPGEGRPIEAAVYRGGEHREVRSEEHTSELQPLMRHSYAVFFLKKKKKTHN